MATAARARCGARLSATTLARDAGIPLPTAQKLLQRLTHAGLLTSTRGAAGGFRLTRPAAAISLADIVEAVDGPIALNACASLDEPPVPHWAMVNDAVRGALAGVPLTRLAERAQ